MNLALLIVSLIAAFCAGFGLRHLLELNRGWPILREAQDLLERAKALNERTREVHDEAKQVLADARLNLWRASR